MYTFLYCNQHNKDAAAVKLVADKLATNEHNAVIAEISLISRSGEVLVSADTYEV